MSDHVCKNPDCRLHGKTGKEKEQAREQLMQLLIEEQVSGQPWTKAWREHRGPVSDESIEWMRARPPAVKALLIRFPPSCLVSAVRGKSLMIPAPGLVGIVTSYFENGSMTVRMNPVESLRAECEPSWLTVESYWNGLTPDRMRKILGM